MTAPAAPPLTPPAITPDITVAGRRFVSSTSTTFRQDLYVMQLIADAGLERMSPAVMAHGYELDTLSEQVILAAFASGKLFPLLGAVLEEVGVPWTLLGAKENAEFFANLRDPQDKAALNASIAAVILGFFMSGLLSSGTSRRSSTSSPGPRQNDTANDDASRNFLGVPETLATGTASSASSPATGPTATTES